MCEDFKKTYTTVTTALGDLSKTITPTPDAREATK